MEMTGRISHRENQSGNICEFEGVTEPLNPRLRKGGGKCKTQEILYGWVKCSAVGLPLSIIEVILMFGIFVCASLLGCTC
jgi:hypothetical protein